MPASITAVSKTQSILGENPLWDERGGRLLSVDAMGRKLLAHGPDLALQAEWPLSRGPGSFALRAKGGLLMANRQGLAFAELGSDQLEEIPTPGVDFSRELFNDGKCDSRGRFWTGTMIRQTEEPVCALYRLGTDLQFTRMDEGVTLSNGIAWSPDERTMYYCDSRPGHIWAYDYDIDRGEIANRRKFVDFADRDGHPDGCTIDAEGGLWVAEVGAGQIVRFDPAGREVAKLAVPTSRVTSVAFGGPDLRTLFITSMRFSLTPEELEREPQAGCIFAADMDVAGLPFHPFGG